MMNDVAFRVMREDVDAILARELPWQKLSGCRIAVTGAGGFLGGYLIRSLLALNRTTVLDEPVSVVALVRDVERARTKFADCADDPQLLLSHWDLNTLAVPTIGAVNYIIHNASQASPRYYNIDPMGTMLPNMIGTAALLEVLRDSPDPKGFMFVSSSEVYGDISGARPVREDDIGQVDQMQVRSCYAESKRAGEALCVAFHHQHRIPAWIVRPFHTYGPGLLPDDGRVFSDFAYNVARKQNIVMKSDGSARRAFCYVSDALAGFYTVLLKGTSGTAYNVANSRAELSIMELAELLVSLSHEQGLRVERAVADETKRPSDIVHRIIPDTRRLEELGWRAEIAPGTGFQRMIETLK